MSNQQARKILRELNEKAKEYSAKATALSDLLEEAEAFLSEMPGKIEISVGEGNDKLSFERLHNGWGLWIGDPGFGDRVTEAAVPVKARAAQLLPELVSKLFATVAEHLQEVDAGLEALENVPFLDSSKEGK